jgi:H+-translocating NAD(P) transhydrogenase subunit beta
MGYLYLISAVCFIYALKGLSSHKESRLGNMVGIIGMAIALFACISSPSFHNKALAISAIIVGGSIGVVIAQKIQMTMMPQLVAAFHSLVGIAAVFVAYAAYLSPEGLGISIAGVINKASLIEMSLGASIGAITFTGSVIAFAKLQGIMSSKVIKFPSQQYVSIACIAAILVFISLFVLKQNFFLFNLIVFISLAVGVLLIIPVGGADMPVVVSMLNSYSGWAAVGIGFTLQNNLLIITGALVGASGAILSFVMCKAMNRPLFVVIFGAFLPVVSSENSEIEEDRAVNPSSPEDAAFTLSNSTNVIIVPGYGMAVAQAQHAVKELVNLLTEKGVNVKFAIHPVAGRMPGHMNVLLAEANIPYEIVHELEEINGEFSNCDVAIVIGANDVTNPAAKNDKTSPIYGMPILEVENAKNVFFIKRSMASGYAGIQNELFYSPNTFMLFGDAKKVIEELVKSFKEI